MWMLFALLAAASFGLRGILYHWSSQQPMNRELMLFGVFSMGAACSLTVSLFMHQEWENEALIGILMGMLSFAASAAMYQGFAVGKASLIAILTGMPPVVVVLLAYLVWGETLSPWQLSAFGVIVIAVILLRYSNDLSFKQLKGVQWGLLAMMFFGLNDMTGKQSTLLEAPLLPTMFCMFATGAVLFGAWWLLARKRSAGVRQSDPNAWGGTKTFFWGMVVGLTNTAGMVAILTAFETGVTALVSAVVALNVLVILGYTRLYTKEKFKRLELAGIALSVLGMMVLRLFP